MAEDRAGDSARVAKFGRGVGYKSLEGKSNISAVSRSTFGHEGSGGRIHVTERSPEDMGPRDMTKFDSSNKEHVSRVTSAAKDNSEGMLIHSGGHFSTPAGKVPVKKPVKRAVKPASTLQTQAQKAKSKQASLAANEERMKLARKKLAEKNTSK